MPLVRTTKKHHPAPLIKNSASIIFQFREERPGFMKDDWLIRAQSNNCLWSNIRYVKPSMEISFYNDLKLMSWLMLDMVVVYVI